MICCMLACLLTAQLIGLWFCFLVGLRLKGVLLGECGKEGELEGEGKGRKGKGREGGKVGVRFVYKQTGGVFGRCVS